MPQLTGGDAVYQTLIKLGVQTVFGIPSVHNIPIFDAISRGGDIETVIVRNEQAGVHAADGYYRSTGKIGVMIASTGPGTTNAVTGMYEAAFASSRVLLITGQVDSIFYGKGRGMGHEAEKQVPMLQTVIDSVASPKSPQEIVPALLRIVSEMMSGKPGPGALEIPVDLQYRTTDVQIPDFDAPVSVTPSESDVDAAVHLLNESKRIAILAGGGVVASNASDALVAWAEAIHAPVFTSTHGRGIINDTHPLCMGSYLGSRQFNQLMGDIDLLVAVGTWFQGGWRAPLPGKLLHIDIDPRKINLVYNADASVIGDALHSIKTLHSAMKVTAGDSDFLEAMQSARDDVRRRIRERIGPDHESIMDTIRSQLPDDAIVVRDMTIPAYTWGNQLLPLYAPRTTMSPYSGAIGPGLPLAIGASTATGKKTAIIQGDGGFMVHIGELSTAVQYRLPIVICVFTDGGYGVLRGIQARTFEGRTIGVNLATPNFAAVARGFGLEAENVGSAGEFEAAFKKAIKADGPYLIDIDTSSLVPISGMGKPVKFSQPKG